MSWKSRDKAEIDERLSNLAVLSIERKLSDRDLIIDRFSFVDQGRRLRLKYI